MRLDHNLVRLPLRVDSATLATEIRAISEDEWRPHPEGAPGNTALPLIAAGGNPDNDAAEGVMAPTPFLAQLPYTRRILHALGATIGRTRLMRIATETELASHVDTNYYWWHHLRIHVPVLTTPDVVFQVGAESAHMAAGEVWAFDTWRRHRVDNPASSSRTHLVIDTVGSAALWDLLERPDQEPTFIDPARPEPAELPVEIWNRPIVMPASEAEATVASLLAQARTRDPDGADRAEAVLTPFLHDWRDLWARFGGTPDGWPSRRALLERTATRLTDAIGGVALPNGIMLLRAVVQLVLDAALNPGLARPVAITDTATQPRPAATTPGRGRPSTRSLLAGAPRIADPVFLVCPPRSGSSLLFETLARSPELFTIGGESHRVIEDIPALTPAAHDWASNRLDADDITDGVVSFLKDQFVVRLRDRDGARPAGGDVRLLEKTPKNALRVPFLAAAFPDARFVYLYRDPRETISSMLDAWRSGKFVTYPSLPGWSGSPWSLLLTPGWQELAERPLGEVVARQWATTVDTLLDDLEALDPDRWCVAAYDRLVADPLAEITRLCSFLDVAWDDDLSEPLPDSRHTLDSPHPDKWRRNAEELEPHLELIVPTAERARRAFAEPPRTRAVEAEASADRPPKAPRPARHVEHR